MGRMTASLSSFLASSQPAIESHLTFGFRCTMSLSSASARSLNTLPGSNFLSGSRLGDGMSWFMDADELIVRPPAPKSDADLRVTFIPPPVACEEPGLFMDGLFDACCLLESCLFPSKLAREFVVAPRDIAFSFCAGRLGGNGAGVGFVLLYNIDESFTFIKFKAKFNYNFNRCQIKRIEEKSNFIKFFYNKR